MLLDMTWRANHEENVSQKDHRLSWFARFGVSLTLRKERERERLLSQPLKIRPHAEGGLCKQNSDVKAHCWEGDKAAVIQR